jgi:transposase
MLLNETTEIATAEGDVITRIETRDAFDALFREGASVTAGAPSELKFLLDRATDTLYFLPPAFAFHFEFYRQVLDGPWDNAEFNARTYNRPDRDFAAGTVTAYDSFVDPTSGGRGILCFSLWPTDRFTPELLAEIRTALTGALTFLGPDQELAFRTGGPIQERLAREQAVDLAAAGVRVRTNVEISAGLTYMALSLGTALGTLVVVEPGEAMPTLRRTQVALFLGDVPADAPPVAAMITAQVQTFNSHLGIRYRQDHTPFCYKALTTAEADALRAWAGRPVEVTVTGQDGTVREATAEEAAAYLEKIRPTERMRLAPDLDEQRIRSFSELLADSVRDGRWNRDLLAVYGRKTLGVVQLTRLARGGAFGSGAPAVVAPVEPFGIPASVYRRFLRETGIAERVARLTADPRFLADAEWQARKLADLRDRIEDADVPAGLVADLRRELVEPYLAAHPGARSARLRSSAPVVEDSGSGALPNMAGAFDSHTARWTDPDAATDAIVATLAEVYASVFNDRAIAELTWHRVDLDEDSVTMAVLVMPNEDDELANGVLRVNADLAGFFSITGETQFGENLVTNPEAGATPDTWVDGNYDVLDGVVRQDIEYERFSNLVPLDPARPRAFTDPEIMAAYDAMRVVRSHFARLEGLRPESYLDECEVKILATGAVQLKQERPWLD